jgi:hypothetical protein
MQTSLDENAFEWICSGRDRRRGRDDPGWRGNFVSHLLPKAFAAYAKVFHRIDAYYENIDSPLSQKESEIIRIPPCIELRSFIQDLRANRRGTQVRWKELAETFDVPFQPELNLEWYRTKLGPGCWPRFLKGPDEGTLDSGECAALVSVLLAFTGNQECFFRFAEIPFIGTNKQLSFHGALEEVVAFLDDGTYQFTPEYWWPANRSWCGCSDYDLMFTVVGGAEDLISRLLRNDVLECIEVTPSTRIDCYAPMP